MTSSKAINCHSISNIQNTRSISNTVTVSHEVKTGSRSGTVNTVTVNTVTVNTQNTRQKLVIIVTVTSNTRQKTQNTR